ITSEIAARPHEYRPLCPFTDDSHVWSLPWVTGPNVLGQCLEDAERVTIDAYRQPGVDIVLADFDSVIVDHHTRSLSSLSNNSLICSKRATASSSAGCRLTMSRMSSSMV